MTRRTRPEMYTTISTIASLSTAHLSCTSDTSSVWQINRQFRSARVGEECGDNHANSSQTRIVAESSSRRVTASSNHSGVHGLANLEIWLHRVSLSVPCIIVFQTSSQKANRRQLSDVRRFRSWLLGPLRGGLLSETKAFGALIYRLLC